MTKIKLNKQSADAIMALIEAGDTDLGKHLQNVDIEASLPYVLVLFKHARPVASNLDDKKELIAAWYAALPTELKQILQANEKFNKTEDMNMPYSNLSEMVKDYPEEDRVYFMDRFTEVLHKHVIEWGFGFLKDYDMKFTRKESK